MLCPFSTARHAVPTKHRTSLPVWKIALVMRDGCEMFLVFLVLGLGGGAGGVNLVLKIPGSKMTQDEGYLRLDYR